MHLKCNYTKGEEIRCMLIETGQRIVIFTQFLWRREVSNILLETSSLQRVDEDGIAQTNLLVSANTIQIH